MVAFSPLQHHTGLIAINPGIAQRAPSAGGRLTRINAAGLAAADSAQALPRLADRPWGPAATFADTEPT